MLDVRGYRRGNEVFELPDPPADLNGFPGHAGRSDPAVIVLIDQPEDRLLGPYTTIGSVRVSRDGTGHQSINHKPMNDHIALILKKANTTIFRSKTPWRKRDIWVSPYDLA